MTKAEHCKNRLLPDEYVFFFSFELPRVNQFADLEKCLGSVGLTMTMIAEQMIRILTEPQYGDGNIVEMTPLGTNAADTYYETREVPLELLYPQVVGNHLGSEDAKFVERLKEKGVREWMH